MRYMNKSMKQINKDIFDEINIEAVDISGIENIVTPNIVNINECYILDLENELSSKNINWNRLMKMHGDRTGYEASCNELRINDYVDDNKTRDEILIYGLRSLHSWKDKLKRDYPNQKFVLILSVNEKFVTLRFHAKREGENWLSSDLERYQESILVEEL
ncbi:hypothetical protein ABE236_26675 [Priestia endophytica]|uniref:hypothetical protein n=1 Tax=Priestia endophytica TaxID=135735 RepID=UPI003D29FE64